MTISLLLVPVAVLLGAWLAVRLCRGRRRWVRVVAAAVTAVVVLGAGLQVWARTSLDSSAVARAMVWFEADVDDIDRFARRPIPAGDDPLPLRTGRLPADALDPVRVGDAGQGLDALMAAGRTAALIVLRDDEVLVERYAHGGAADRPHTSFSVAKYYGPDLRAVALDARVEGPPGERWVYNNYNPLLMGLVLERATGTSVSDYMSRHLWQPMGAESDASWSLDSEASGFEKLESGVNAVPRDYARFGYLFAHEGRVGDRQVVPGAWAHEATTLDAAGDPAEHYQYWWWVDTEREGRFYARGNHGQYVYVDPATDVVVVRSGREGGDVPWPEVLRHVADRVADAA